MTSPTSGFRRSVSVAGVAFAALALTACGAGQHSQTAAKVAAVDGGYGASQNVVVNDFRVVVPVDEAGTREEGPAQVAFVASYSGPGVGDPEGAALESVTIGGANATIEGQDARIKRDCTLVANTKEAEDTEATGAATEPQQAGGDTPCIVYVTVSLPDAASLEIGQSVDGEIRFAGEDPIDTKVAVGAPREKSGEFSRPVETNEAESH